MIEDNDYFLDIDPDDNHFNTFYRSLELADQSNYSSVSNFNSNHSNQNSFFSICNYNIRSFNCNYDYFLAFLNTLEFKFSMFILTETRFASGCGRSIEGYDGYHICRVNGRGGGVSIFCDNALVCRSIDELSFVN